MNLWTFAQEQLFRMTWLRELFGRLLQGLGFDAQGKAYEIIHFFLYDTVKIFALLCTLVFAVSYVQSYFPPQRAKAILGRLGLWRGRCVGALLGILTPFCACSSIPLFIGFTAAGLPVSVTLSFLIMSPMADMGSLVFLSSQIGWKAAAGYLAAGFAVAVSCGTLIEAAGLGRDVPEYILSLRSADMAEESLSVRDRLAEAWDRLRGLLDRVWPYVLIGVAIGSLIHNAVPEGPVQALLGSGRWYSVPLACLVGVPMYADIFGAIPIASGLLYKGAGLGTVISFMMSVTALSLPSLIMLKQAMKPRLLAAFALCVTLGIMAVGVLFNLCEGLFL